MSMATECLLRTLDDARMTYTHLDIADRRGFRNMNRIDVANVVLAVRSGVEFARRLLSFRPDVVYMPVAQSTLGFLRDALFLVPAKLTRRRVVVHLHGCQLNTFYRGAPCWLQSLMRWSLRDVQIAIVLGDGGESQFRDLVPEDRVRVIPNGLPVVEVPHFRPRNGDNSVTVLYLSILMREKGILDLLAAVDALGGRADQLRLIFAGEWYSDDDERQFRAHVDRLGLGDRVRLVGAVEGVEKERVLAGADIFVLPPRHVEGLPFAILEAMRAGLPVITTDSGFISQVVIDEYCGLVVPRGDVPALADAIGSLVRSSTLRREMGRRARERFLSEYTLDTWATRVLAALRDAGTAAPASGWRG